MSTINNKSISSWVRQARHRAKRHSIYSDLEVTDVAAIVAAADNRCSYCGKEAETLDCPFPFKEGGPHVPANVVPCCKGCKAIKNNNDVVWMFLRNHITNDRYLALIQDLL